MRRRFLPLGAALVVFVAAGCGGGQRQPTLSAHQVVAALRAHGVQARTTWRKGVPVPQSGVDGLINSVLGESPHVIATVQSSTPKVYALIYDSAEHAKQRLNVPTTGVPVSSRITFKTVGRAYRVSNVILEIDQAARIPDVSAATHDLALEAPSK